MRLFRSTNLKLRMQSTISASKLIFIVKNTKVQTDVNLRESFDQDSLIEIHKNLEGKQPCLSCFFPTQSATFGTMAAGSNYRLVVFLAQRYLSISR